MYQTFPSMQLNEVTPAKFAATVKDWRGYAKEAGKVTFSNSTFYFFGSEVATLRLLLTYRETKAARCGYSENLKTHYFALEMQGWIGEHATE